MWIVRMRSVRMMNKKRDSEGRAGSPSVAATTVPQMSPTTAAFARTPVRVWQTGSLAQRLPFGAAECLRLLPAPTRPGRARPAAGASHSRAGQTRTPAPFSWRRWTSGSGRTTAGRSGRPQENCGPSRGIDRLGREFCWNFVTAFFI